MQTIARHAGLPDADRAMDARELVDDDTFADVVDRTAVFGRVTPDQKSAMVTALQAKGHTVAMTGDGVNDVLALKQSDLAIAMGAGSDATKAVAQLILLDNAFSTLPGVVAEGRRVTANIERVAGMFLTKTVWAAFAALSVAVLALPYPLLPRQLTLVDTLSIGVPAFFLALAPNTRRYRPGFMRRVVRFTVPVGVVVAARHPGQLPGGAGAGPLDRPGPDADHAAALGRRPAGHHHPRGAHTRLASRPGRRHGGAARAVVRPPRSRATSSC